jgi:thioredoxin 2
VTGIFSAACPNRDTPNNIWDDAEARQAKCGRCDHSMFEWRSIDINTARFAKHVAAGQIPLLVLFWLPMGRHLIQRIDLPKYAKQFEPRLRIAKLNMDDDYDLAQAHGVGAAPTLALFRDGRLVTKKLGAPNMRDKDHPIHRHGQPDRIMVWLEEHVGVPAA